MALGADDMQAACIDHVVVQRLPFVAQLLRLELFLGLGQTGVRLDNLDLLFDITAQYDIGTTTGHVGRNRDHFRTTCLCNDFRFTRMLLGIQHVMRQFGIGENARQQFGILD